MICFLCSLSLIFQMIHVKFLLIIPETALNCHMIFMNISKVLNKC